MDMGISASASGMPGINHNLGIPASNSSAEGKELSIPQNLNTKAEYELSLSDQAILKAIEQANKAINGVGINLQYSVHEKTGAIVVKVINSETKEIVKEIPSEKILDLIVKLQEIAGIMIDEKR